MTAYLSRRILQLFVVLLAVSTVLFCLLRASGNPATLLAGPFASRQSVAQISRDMGFDAPLWDQYLRFLIDAARLQFGVSTETDQSAISMVWTHLPYTLVLAGTSLGIALIAGTILGTISGSSRGRVISTIVYGATSLVQAAPTFLLGVLLMFAFSVRLHWLPSFGTGGISHLVLPAITLAAWPTAQVMLLVRSELQDVLRADYIRTAKAKGVPRFRRIWKHALPNALTAMVTVAGTDLAELLGGAVIVETVFSWPGIGQLLLQSVDQRDYPVVQATVFVVAVLVVVVNTAVDLLYRLLDPRLGFT